MTVCPICKDIIWGCGRQGVECFNCRFTTLRRSNRTVKYTCGQPLSFQQLQPFLTIPTYPSFTQPIEKCDSSTRKGKSFTPDSERISSPKTGYLKDTDHDEKGIIEADNSFHIGIKDFDFIRVIGRGAYAKVMMVRLKETGTIYAMKIIKKELISDDEDIDWVQTEKHVFDIASNHPFLVGLHSCFQTCSRLFFVLEFVNGGDLMFHMQRKRRLEESHARFYSAEICCALNYLHGKGIIYRDLKLDNVLLDSDGHVKLTDYGMCKEGLRPGERTNTFCGTPNYIAPEIIIGEDYGASVDWWALGVLLYEMIAGRSPFPVVTERDTLDKNTEEYVYQIILNKPIRIPRSFSVKASYCLKGFLNKNPRERLGCRKAGFVDIKQHIFFQRIDWVALERRQVAPPFKPKVDEEEDILSNFDPMFTTEPVILTPDEPSYLTKLYQSEFEGFEYINPLLMPNESESV